MSANDKLVPVNERPVRVLAFDFGTRRMGVAIGQNLTQTATPLPEIKANDGIPDWNLIENILREWQPDCVLTGLPLNMDGSENEMCLRARKFAKRLHGRFGLPSYLWDERLTSRDIKTEKPGQDFGKQAIDSLAAVSILESWFYSGMPTDL